MDDPVVAVGPPVVIGLAVAILLLPVLLFLWTRGGND